MAAKKPARPPAKPAAKRAVTGDAPKKPSARSKRVPRVEGKAPERSPTQTSENAPVPAVTAQVPTAPAPLVLAPELEAEVAHALSEDGGPAGERLGAKAISRLLQEISELLQLTNANAFKVRAYENAARALAGLEDFDELLASGRLVDVPGIGASIAEKISTLATTGKLDYLAELRAQVPSGLLDLLRIPGLGPKKALALHDGLEIGSIDELEAACRAGRLEGLRGFGAKTAENILLGIEQLRRVQGTFLWSFAHGVVEPAIEALRKLPAVRRVEFAGSLRRRKETVHDVDIVLATDDAGAVMEAFAVGPWAARLLGKGETKTSVVHPSGLQMDLRAVTDAQYPYALHHFTGSKQHNIAMRGRAIRMGLKMNEYGLFRGDDLVLCADEKEIFAALGLEFIPPELREDTGEIEAAESGSLPADLLEPGDLRGAFHVHTTDSDGRDTLEVMVRGALQLGWEYVGIADHGPGAVYAHGLEPERIAAQRRAIEALRRELPGIRILHGIEAEVLPDGRLGLDDATLAALDFVIAAVHSSFHLTRDEQTRRLVRAVEHPHVTILAHPTGRVLLRRSGYDVDLPAVFEAAARSGVAIEIDSHPQRMDVDGAAARAARDRGALLCISPDAHAVDGLADVRYGVGLARRGWLEPRHVLNTRKFEEVQAHLQARKAAAGARRA